MMIDVSIATVFSEVYFDYFSVFFQVSPFVCKKKITFYFCVLVLTKYVSGKKILGDVIVSCMTKVWDSRWRPQIQNGGFVTLL